MKPTLSRRLFVGLASTLLLLSACEGGGSGGSSGVGSSGSSGNVGSYVLFDDSNLTGDNVAEIAGVWDESFDWDGEIDVLYFVINADGRFAYVDYLGDPISNGGHCYDIFRGRVTKFSDGYVFDTPYSNNPQQFYRLKVINDELTFLNESGQPMFSYPRVPGGLDPTIPECAPES